MKSILNIESKNLHEIAKDAFIRGFDVIAFDDSDKNTVLKVLGKEVILICGSTEASIEVMSDEENNS